MTSKSRPFISKFETEPALEVVDALLAAASAALPGWGIGVLSYLDGVRAAQDGRWVEAAMSLSKAIAYCPEFETARFMLGLVQFRTGEPAVAVVTWEPLSRLPSKHPVRALVDKLSHLAAGASGAVVESFAADMALDRVNQTINVGIMKVVAAVDAACRPALVVAASGHEDDEDALAHVLLEVSRDPRGPVH